MNRIIINNKSELDDATAIKMVLGSMNKGRIADNGKQYAPLSSLMVDGNPNEYYVACSLREKSDSFTVYDVNSLLELIKQDPEWAKNRILGLRTQVDKLAKRIAGEKKNGN